MDRILQRGDSRLRLMAKPVSRSEIKELAFAQLVAEMSRILRAAPDGVALAAPQLGVNKRLFIVLQKLINPAADAAADAVFINPRIKRRSRRQVALDEGCLSVRWLYGKIKRAEKATVEALNERGEKFERSAAGLLAQIFQHEIDHLNGILFTDRAVELREAKPD